MKEQIVYTGQNMDRDIFIEGKKGGYCPLVSIRVEKEGCTFSLHTSPFGARELAHMLNSAANAADPDDNN